MLGDFTVTHNTTTIIEAITHAPESRILLCAFNKRIAVELQNRLANPAAEAATLHSVGFACVRRYWERVRIDDKSARKEWLAREACGQQAPDAMIRLVMKLHTLGREMMPLVTSPEALRQLAYAHDCVPDDDWAQDGYDVDWICQKSVEAMHLAAENRPRATGIDFSDMLFLPVRNRWLRPRYDLVIVDECQDLNVTQLLIAQGVASGRMAVVGDNRQACYAFRGADSGSLDRLKTELQATELGLTTTYRCGQKIVAVAAALVPDFQAAPTNAPGTVSHIAIGDLAARVAIGDFVLSRKNAPLASVALKILRAGKRCKIEGRDIGAGLHALINKLAKGKGRDSMPEFLGKLTTWEQKEIARAEKSGDQAETRIERVRDQADTIRALAESLSGVPELQARIEDLFSDGGGPRVVCSSVHRSKGLEADRVFVLEDTLIREAPCKCGHWGGTHERDSGCGKCKCKKFSEDPQRKIEEQNIEYVALTRAKHELVWVEGLP